MSQRTKDIDTDIFEEDEIGSASDVDDTEIHGLSSLDQDDILISIILRHFDVIENKSTNKSLTPLQLQTTIKNAWNEITDEFKLESGVSLICVFWFRAMRM